MTGPERLPKAMKLIGEGLSRSPGRLGEAALQDLLVLSFPLLQRELVKEFHASGNLKCLEDNLAAMAEPLTHCSSSPVEPPLDLHPNPDLSGGTLIIGIRCQMLAGTDLRSENPRWSCTIHHIPV